MINSSFKPYLHKIVKIFLTILWCYCLSEQTMAQVVQTVAAKKQVVVGEPFVVTILVKDASVKDVTFPELAEKGAEIVRQWANDSTDAQGHAWAVQVYQLMLLQPGEFRLSSFPVVVRKNSISQNLKTPAVAVYAELLPVAQPDLTAEPLAAISYTRNEWLPYALGLAGLFVGSCGWAIYRKRKDLGLKRTLNPRKQALRQLKEVTDNGISPIDKTYALHMSHILKDYLTARFGIAAHHLTVSEITQELTRQGLDAVKVTHSENLLQQLQFLIYHPATDTKSRPASLVGELRQTIELLEK